MEQIKDELGSDAVLLHTKKYREGGVLGGEEMIEVTAAVDETQTRVPRTPSAYVPPAAPILPTNVVNQYRMSEIPAQEGASSLPAEGMLPLYHAYAPEMPPAQPYAMQEPTAPPLSNMPESPPDALPQQPVPSAYDPAAAPAQEPAVPSAPDASADDGSAERIRLLEDELAQMKTMLASMMAANKPKEVVSIRDALRRQDVHEELCEDLSGKISITDVNAFIGTTGVGKTTTLAKIAAHFVLEQNLKGALITADTYRISAVEQLKKYAEILGLPVEVVYSAADLRKAITRHRSKDFVLVDTAGRSQYNEFQMDELKELLMAHPRMEKHLVVSATTKEQDAAEIIDRFSVCAPNRIIFTKTDETRSIGMVLNLLAQRELPLSFLSNGQSVPDDIIPATAERLAELLLRE